MCGWWEGGRQLSARSSCQMHARVPTRVPACAHACHACVRACAARCCRPPAGCARFWPVATHNVLASVAAEGRARCRMFIHATAGIALQKQGMGRVWVRRALAGGWAAAATSPAAGRAAGWLTCARASMAASHVSGGALQDAGGGLRCGDGSEIFAGGGGRGTAQTLGMHRSVRSTALAQAARRAARPTLLTCGRPGRH